MPPNLRDLLQQALFDLPRADLEATQAERGGLQLLLTEAEERPYSIKADNRVGSVIQICQRVCQELFPKFKYTSILITTGPMKTEQLKDYFARPGVVGSFFDVEMSEYQATSYMTLVDFQSCALPDPWAGFHVVFFHDNRFWNYRVDEPFKMMLYYHNVPYWPCEADMHFYMHNEGFPKDIIQTFDHIHGSWTEMPRLKTLAEELAAHLDAWGHRQLCHDLLNTVANLNGKFHAIPHVFPLQWQNSGAFQAVLDFYEQLKAAENALSLRPTQAQTVVEEILEEVPLQEDSDNSSPVDLAFDA